MYEVARIIKNKRIKDKISLQMLSKVTNISISTLSKLENNKIKNPSSVFLYRICKVLNLDYEEVLRLRWDLFPTFLYERNIIIGGSK